MTEYKISYTDFSDSYLLYYGAGCMGDFLASLMVYSFRKSSSNPQDYNGPDSFYYEPWSKKWVTRDSSDNQLRRFITKRMQPGTNTAISVMLEMAKEYDGTHFEFRGVKDPGFKHHLGRMRPNENNELLIVLPLICSILKRSTIPYLFVAENFGAYITTADYMSRLQTIPEINFIEAGFYEPKHRPLYFLLSLFKNKLHYNKCSAEDFERGRENFINEAKYIIEKGRNFEVKNHIVDYKKYIQVDMVKLVLNNDLQGLDMLPADDIGIKNMISTARTDMFEILDFFELDLDNFPEFDDKKLNEIYDKMKIVIDPKL